jgi:transposase
MAKYKTYNYSQEVLIPVSLEDQIMPGTLEFAIHTLMETRMDMSVFDEKYHNDETGRSAYDPKVLLKVVLFGYSRGLISSRRIERACRENIIFMALSCGQQPDHSTIAAFVSSMKDEILFLFRDILFVCEEMSLLGGTFFALDGCKLSSNASGKLSGTYSALSGKKDKIEKMVERLLKEQVDTDRREDDEDKGGGPTGILHRDKQIERLKKQAERIDKWLDENSVKIGKQGKEIRSNITDNESGTMVSSHGPIQGYNGQALVDSKHQVIVHAEAFGSGDDSDLIVPMLDGAKENIQAIGKSEDYFAGKTFTADSNYHSPTNLNKCGEESLDAYIPDKRFRKRAPKAVSKKKHRPGDTQIFSLADFQYNGLRDEYICPQKTVLRLRARKVIADGVIYRRYAADKKDCKGCELKVSCIRRKNGKRRHLSIPVGSVAGNLTKAMAQKLDSEKGRKIYSKRLAIVEPVFANIRTHKAMDRFTLRGKIKVTIQWMLFCMVHNIGKILRYGFT